MFGSLDLVRLYDEYANNNGQDSQSRRRSLFHPHKKENTSPHLESKEFLAKGFGVLRTQPLPAIFMHYNQLNLIPVHLLTVTVRTLDPQTYVFSSFQVAAM